MTLSSDMRSRLAAAADRATTRAVDSARWTARADAIVAGCFPKQRAFVEDESDFVAARTARRCGKSRGGVNKILSKLERGPEKIAVIIGLTLKSAKRNYWAGPSGVKAVSKEYRLELSYHDTDLTWRHENGSWGFLAGAETEADLENLRGIEADIVLIDECKAFAPDHLRYMIDDIITPMLMSRGGQLVLVSTPGTVLEGPYYEASQPGIAINSEESERQGRVVLRDARIGDVPTCLLHGASTEGIPHPGDLWRLHTWTLQDNDKTRADQWAIALKKKRKAGWSDEHPTWRREYLGQWAAGEEGLVYWEYVRARLEGKCTWEPNGVASLPRAAGPWHLIMGLDCGYQDDTALVVAAYSEVTEEMRVLHCEKHPHLLIDAVGTMIQAAMAQFGQPQAIVADCSDLQFVASLAQLYSLPVVKAERTHKESFIELLNADFARGTVLIPRNSHLDRELCALDYDLSRGRRDHLARVGRLKENPQQPNHLCDALLYLHRYSLHRWARTRDEGPEEGTPEWHAQEDRRAFLAELARQRRALNHPQRLPGTPPKSKLAAEARGWTPPRFFN